MATTKYKHMDVDIIAFLEKQMESHVQHYQCDFDVDIKVIKKAAASERKEDKTLLWMGRTMGTHCLKEHDAFIRDTSAYNTWRYYAEQSSEPIIAYAAEITGTVDGVIRGNVYELDYRAHAAEMLMFAVDPAEVEKTYEDGFVDRVPVERSSYGYYVSLVEQHGPIIDSLTHPRDIDRHAAVLSQQTVLRELLKASPSKESLNQQITSAKERAGNAGTEHSSRIKNTKYSGR